MDTAEQTCVYRLTPPTPAALASLAVCGPEAVRLVAQRFLPAGQRPLDEVPVGRVVFGHWLHAGGEEVVVTVRHPQRVDIHGHGGTAASQAVLDSLEQAGARAGSWQEWLAEDQPPCLGRAAQQALVQARTERTAGILLDQWQGGLEGEIQQVLACLQHHQTNAGLAQIDQLLARCSLGRHLTEPFRIVLAGQPNVGKSSLINAILGYPRAIVTDQAGTTRDVVTASTAIDGWPVVLSDTAGLRRGADELEVAGVQLAVTALAAADLVVLVFDQSQAWTAADQRLCQAWPDALRVYNKCDLPAAAGRRPAGLPTSATRQLGLPELLGQIAGRLVPVVPLPGAGVPWTAAQEFGLQEAREACRAGDLSAAEAALRGILG
ncbi:MAG: GTP-binding protein [Planctomycetales bacterium]|nr:GTP-binding protein [Planctomycetales bacterium]